MLDEAWADHERQLGFAPDQPVTVVLQTAKAFYDTTRAPGWAAAWNDGTIRVPVMGLDRPTPGLVRVLRHEMAHSFVASRTGANCPTWLQEGLAQWLEGGDPAREDAGLASLARSSRLPQLESLERPFVGLSERRPQVAYAEQPVGRGLHREAVRLRRRAPADRRARDGPQAGGGPARRARPQLRRAAAVLGAEARRQPLTSGWTTTDNGTAAHEANHSPQ